MNRHLEVEFTKKPDEAIAEVLASFTVTDLREISNSSLARGDELLGKTDKSIEILDQGEVNLIRWWRIRSNGSEYEVRRFENFCFCSCYDHFFTKQCCRHITFTTRFYCGRCHKREAPFGQICSACEASVAPYLKPTTGRVPERIGSVRI